MSRPVKAGLSTPTPIAFRPLSTYTVAPVIAEAKGDARNAAVFPTSSVRSNYRFRYSETIEPQTTSINTTIRINSIVSDLPAYNSFCKGAFSSE